MTESELEILRIKVSIVALRVAVYGLYVGMANSSPTAAKAIREKFASVRKEYDKIALSGVGPEMSDTVAAEYREALDELLTFIESGIRY